MVILRTLREPSNADDTVRSVPSMEPPSTLDHEVVAQRSW